MSTILIHLLVWFGCGAAGCILAMAKFYLRYRTTRYTGEANWLTIVWGPFGLLASLHYLAVGT